MLSLSLSLSVCVCVCVVVYRRVPQWLSARILEFYEYKVASSRSALQSAKLDDLPRDLAMLLQIELHRELIQKSLVFQARRPPCYTPLAVREALEQGPPHALHMPMHAPLTNNLWGPQALPPHYVLALLRTLRPAVFTPGHVCIHEGDPSVTPRCLPLPPAAPRCPSLPPKTHAHECE